jgi:site-specific DNA recombinase
MPSNAFPTTRGLGSPEGAHRQGACDGPHPPALRSPDDDGGGPSHPAESDLHGSVPLLGKMHNGSHSPLIAQELFDDVQAGLHRKPRARYPKQKHAFMGLLTCGRCRCAMTAEKKKGKLRLLPLHGASGRLWERLHPRGAVGRPAQRVVGADRDPGRDRRLDRRRHPRGDTCGLEQERQQALAQATQRRRGVQAKLDRGYEDYLEGRISEGFWTRKSEEWEAELAVVEGEVRRLSQPTPAYAVTAEKS